MCGYTEHTVLPWPPLASETKGGHGSIGADDGNIELY